MIFLGKVAIWNQIAKENLIEAELEKKLSEGYRVCQKECLDIASEFEAADLEGWDDRY